MIFERYDIRKYIDFPQSDQCTHISRSNCIIYSRITNELYVRFVHDVLWSQIRLLRTFTCTLRDFMDLMEIRSKSVKIYRRNLKLFFSLTRIYPHMTI